MNTLRLVLMVLLIMLLLPELLVSQSLDHLALVAWYPLTSTPNDSTGNYPPMWMTNVPYQDGGIYCNGIYNDGSNADACDAQTPNITALSFRELAVTVDFKIHEYPIVRMPVFVCHPYSWRWLYVFIERDSTIGFGTANDFYQVPSTRVKCPLDEWHSVTVTWDSLKSAMTLFFNHTPIDTILVPELQHGYARRAGIAHGGVGRVFKGWLRNLKIYSYQSDVTSVAERNAGVSFFDLQQNYPNPFNPTTTIEYALPKAGHVRITIYDMLGRHVRTLVDSRQPAGRFQTTWDGRDELGVSVGAGVYFYKIEAGEFVQTNKMVLVR